MHCGPFFFSSSFSHITNHIVEMKSLNKALMFKFISYAISEGKYLSSQGGHECVVHFTILDTYVILKLLFRNREMFFFFFKL